LVLLTRSALGGVATAGKLTKAAFPPPTVAIRGSFNFVDQDDSG
jgi:hypothetical protein